MVSVLSKVSVLSRLSKKTPRHKLYIKTKADKEEGGYQTYHTILLFGA